MRWFLILMGLLISPAYAQTAEDPVANAASLFNSDMKHVNDDVTKMLQGMIQKNQELQQKVDDWTKYAKPLYEAEPSAK